MPSSPAMAWLESPAATQLQHLALPATYVQVPGSPALEEFRQARQTPGRAGLQGCHSQPPGQVVGLVQPAPGQPGGFSLPARGAESLTQLAKDPGLQRPVPVVPGQVQGPLQVTNGLLVVPETVGRQPQEALPEVGADQVKGGELENRRVLLPRQGFIPCEGGDKSQHQVSPQQDERVNLGVGGGGAQKRNVAANSAGVSAVAGPYHGGGSSLQVGAPGTRGGALLHGQDAFPEGVSRLKSAPVVFKKRAPRQEKEIVGASPQPGVDDPAGFVP